jgi:hypothetical protein
MAITTTAVPLTVPLGSTGRSLTISDDGQTISIEGRTVALAQLMSRSASCESDRKKSGHKSAESGARTSSSMNAKAIYFMTNAANNSIVALKVAADGTLSDGSITATGGAGMSGLDSSGAPAAPDSLFSQGSVKVAGNVRLPLSHPILPFH